MNALEKLAFAELASASKQEDSVCVVLGPGYTELHMVMNDLPYHPPASVLFISADDNVKSIPWLPI